MNRILIFFSIAAVLGMAFAATAIAAPGDIDTAFGTGGSVLLSDAPASAANSGAAVKVLPNGDLLTLARLGSGRYSISRFNAMGQPDSSFGAAGHVTGSFPSDRKRPTDVVDVDVDDAGAPVVVGTAYRHVPKLHAYLSTVVAMRFTREGVLDRSFGAGGTLKVFLQPLAQRKSEFASAASVHSYRGDVLIGVNTGVEAPRNGFAPRKLGFVRVTKDGKLRRTFGTNGKALLNFYKKSSPGNYFDSVALDAVAIARDGGIIFGASRLSQCGSPDFCPVVNEWYGVAAVARFNSNGRLDKKFGSRGIRFLKRQADAVEPGEELPGVRNINIDSLGRILADQDGASYGINVDGIDGDWIARFNSHGKLDNSFGTSGYAKPADNPAHNNSAPIGMNVNAETGAITQVSAVFSQSVPTTIRLSFFDGNGTRLSPAPSFSIVALSQLPTIAAAAFSADGSILLAGADAAQNASLTKISAN